MFRREEKKYTNALQYPNYVSESVSQSATLESEEKGIFLSENNESAYRDWGWGRALFYLLGRGANIIFDTVQYRKLVGQKHSGSGEGCSGALLEGLCVSWPF